jgi:hypothetical protein
MKWIDESLCERVENWAAAPLSQRLEEFRKLSQAQVSNVREVVRRYDIQTHTKLWPTFVSLLANEHLIVLEPDELLGVLRHHEPLISQSVWTPQFPEYDRGISAADRADCNFEVIGFHEGPSSLVLRGDVFCSGGCGGPWYTDQTMWSSTDAVTWTPIDMPKLFGTGGIGPISGGSAVWWSPDGSNWTRIGLSGTTAANSVYMAVWALDDHTLLAQQSSSSSTGSAGATATWASHDEKSWSLVHNAPSLLVPDLVRSQSQGLLFDWLTDAQGSTIGSQYSILTTRMSFSVVSQTGSSPWIDDWQQALGPMGILITIDGSRFLMGVPTVG